MEDKIIGYMLYERVKEGEVMFLPVEYYGHYPILPTEEEAEKRATAHVVESRLRGAGWFSASDLCIVQIYKNDEGLIMIPSEVGELEIKEFNAGTNT